MKKKLITRGRSQLRSERRPCFLSWRPARVPPVDRSRRSLSQSVDRGHATTTLPTTKIVGTTALFKPTALTATAF